MYIEINQGLVLTYIKCKDVKLILRLFSILVNYLVILV